MLALAALLALATTACTPGVHGNDEHFWHCHVTSAAPESVWARWIDVDDWPAWDRELREATMKDAIGAGARGVLRPRRGPRAKFEITMWQPQSRYAFTTRLPFATLTVTRYFVPHPDGTAFVHEVRFEGAARKGFAKRYGPQFRAALPGVMAALAALAEGESP
ncbi:MAG: SRPBCC family protein [Deltaproteobacteria bacterium]|nr:SRPBCC family protein [Nannocystaceae bacterium]